MSLRPASIDANIILRVPGSPDIQVGTETIHFHPEPTFDKEKYKRILIERSLLNPDDDIVVNFGMLYGGNRSVILTRVSDSAGGLANNGSGFSGLPYIAKPPKTYPTPIFDAMMAEIKATYPDYPQQGHDDSRPDSILQKYKKLLNEACPNYETKFYIQRNPHYYFSNEPGYFREYETLCQREQDKEYWENEYAKLRQSYTDEFNQKGRKNNALSRFEHQGIYNRRVKTNMNKSIYLSQILEDFLRSKPELEKLRLKVQSFPSENLLKFPSLQNNLAGVFGGGPAGAGGGGAPSRSRKRKQRKTQKRKNRRNRTRKN
jgi:hypothetical protein